MFSYAGNDKKRNGQTHVFALLYSVLRPTLSCLWWYCTLHTNKLNWIARNNSKYKEVSGLERSWMSEWESEWLSKWVNERLNEWVSEFWSCYVTEEACWSVVSCCVSCSGPGTSLRAFSSTSRRMWTSTSGEVHKYHHMLMNLSGFFHAHTNLY